MDEERKQRILAIAREVIKKDDELLKRLAEGPPPDKEFFDKLEEFLTDNHEALKRLAGQQITDEINGDPEEMERLLKAREQARTGQTTPLRDAMPDDGP